MPGSLTRILKRWRDNYYLSTVLANSARPVHRASRYMAGQIEKRIRKNGATVPLSNGVNLILARDAGVGITSLLYWHGLDGYEPETSRCLRSLFACSETFVDVGANCGLYSVLGALLNPSLRVIAFEPVAGIFAGLQRNVRLNGVESRVRCENVALSSQSGRATLFLPAHDGIDPETTGTLAAESWQARKSAPRVEVEAIRFDEYEAQHPMRTDLVKIDVEDFESDVLDGMRSVIMRDRPFIVCEILPRQHGNQRTRALVESFQYQPYWITPAGYVRVGRFDFNRGNWTDFLLSPVSTPDTVIDDLSTLVELRRARP